MIAFNARQHTTTELIKVVKDNHFQFFMRSSLFGPTELLTNLLDENLCVSATHFSFVLLPLCASIHKEATVVLASDGLAPKETEE